MKRSQWVRTGFSMSVVMWAWLCGGNDLPLATAQTSIAIDCNAGQTLADGLLSAFPGDTLNISGTCAERVTITTDRITIDGQGSAIIDGGGAPPGGTSSGVITIQGAKGVVLMGLTVQNGPDGIIGRQGAAFTINNVISQDNADEGLQVDENSTARVGNSTFQRNTDEGMSVLRTSSVTFFGTVLSQDNGGDGFLITHNSNVAVFAATNRVTLRAVNNADDGLTVAATSNMGLSSTSLIIEDNDDAGLIIDRNASFFIGSDSELNVSNNGSTGVFVGDVSHADLRASLQSTILNNAGTGLLLSGTAKVDVMSPTLIQDNGSFNVGVVENANLKAEALTIITSDPSRRGIGLNSGTLRLSESSFSGHDIDIFAIFASRLWVLTTTIGGLTCDSTVVVASDIDLACPSEVASTTSRRGRPSLLRAESSMDEIGH